ncbi:hypothetical protein H072_3178 [Dactylellina haptotyla CBS 200.50]|uniref:Calcium-transporting ATPase n=1 Tax=Dactylellina haptotyla (strain CBS 200.50) TaxID=1284197 RepID=S8BTX1_DACHA|nr:hypothetical protein H072_3178 [Dactylellina haptotyla CBS 200.50]
MSDPSQPLGSPKPEVPRITVPQQGTPLSPQSSSLTPGEESIKPASRSGKPFLEVPGSESRSNSIDEKNYQSPTSSNGGTTIAHASAEISDEEALKPDPGTEADFRVEDNRFAFSPGELNKMINPKSMQALKALGGLKGLEYGLRTNVASGLSLEETTLDANISIDEARAKLAAYKGKSQEDEIAPEAPPTPDEEPAAAAQLSEQAFADRIRIYKRNVLPEKKAKSIFLLMWIALQDKVLILLSFAAVISLALGIYQTIQAQKKAKLNPDDPQSKEAHVEWVEGVAIIVAVVIVVVVGAGNDWQKERQFVKLNKKKEDRTVKAMRSGQAVQISVYDILVGDVLYLEPGDMIPADGVFISGHNVKCDESSATGEIDQIKKTAADDCMVQMLAGGNTKKLDPFILSGGKVLEGVGTYLVTSVGVNSSHGKIMMALREDVEATPLQVKLNGLAEGIAKIGGAAALLLFIVLLIRFLANLKNFEGSADEKAQRFIQILITAITIVVVAVPEGLPLAVTLALAFATTRMLRDNNLVRVLRSCETMGNATTVCSDKTGTLTQNKMTVVAGILGKNVSFGSHASGKKGSDEFAMNELNDHLSDEVKGLLVQSIAINSTAFEGEEDGKPTFIGSKTETALLSFARDHLGMGPVAHERSSANVVQLVPFDSARKCMAAVVKLPSGKYRLYVKGASEILLKQTTTIVADPSSPLSELALSGTQVEALESAIIAFANRSLRTIGLVYRDFTEWPPRGARLEEDDSRQAVFSDVFRDMTFLCLVGIQDPLRDGVPEAVKQCQKAGVFVRMVTGDNVITAKAIATECHIYTEGGLVMEGPDFRRLSKAQMREMIPRLQVLARSSPEDKQILVRNLKEMGETVAVTGDGTNDGPALKMADIGFSMGIAGTEVAKEASAIILMDDNFSSIVKALMWGRAVNDAVKKFLQFQITVNITAVLLAFVTAVASEDEQPVLRAVQLLWVNLIMDTFAALALATDPPTAEILNRPPQRKSAPLITVNMWKMIIGQAIYQLVVTFILHFAGGRILGYDLSDETKRDELSSLVFNTFVWMQIFNQYNNRRLDNKFNIFEGIHRNWFFILINVIMVGGQVMIVFIGGAALRVVRLDGPQWAISLILGAISLLIGVVVRLVPDAVFKKVLPKAMYRDRKTPDLFVSDEEHRFEWNQGIEDIRQELQFIKMIRGGRLNSLKFKTKEIKHRLLPLSKSSSHQPPGSPEDAQQPPPSPSSHRRKRSRSNSAFAAAAMVPSIVAGSIGGWSPIEKPHDSERGFPVPVSTSREPSQLSREASDPSITQVEKSTEKSGSGEKSGTRTPPDTTSEISGDKP